MLFAMFDESVIDTMRLKERYEDAPSFHQGRREWSGVWHDGLQRYEKRDSN